MKIVIMDGLDDKPRLYIPMGYGLELMHLTLEGNHFSQRKLEITQEAAASLWPILKEFAETGEVK